MTSTKISSEKQAFFEEQGYLIMPGMFDEDRCQLMRAVAENELHQKVPPLEYEADLNYPGSPPDQTRAGGRTVRRILQAVSRHPEFLAAATDSAMCAVVKSLFKSENSLMLSQNHHNCIMTKDPRFSSDTLWHQDIRYWSFVEDNLISAWLALGSESGFNGGLKILPGSHLKNFSLDSFDPDLFFRTDLEENENVLRRGLQVTLNPGDVFLFHSRLLHSANRNRSRETKLSLVFTYYDKANAPIEGSRSDRLPPIEIHSGDL